MDILKKALLDFFTGKMIIYAISPLILCGFLWVGFVGVVVYYILNADPNTIEQSFNFLSPWIIVVLHWILVALISIGGVLSSVYISVILALFVISFLTPFIVAFVNSRHYNHKNENEISIIKTLVIMGFESLKFLGFFIGSLCVFAIPFIGYLLAPICIFLSLFYVYYKFMIIDVRSCVLDKDKFSSYPKNDFSYKIAIFTFYLISHIPFLGFFAQVFFIIFLTHLVYKKELGYGLSK